MYNPNDPNTITCIRCNKTIWLSEANAVFYLFTVQPWCSYWMVICDNCQTPHRCFVRDNLQKEYEWAQRNKVGVITEQFPDSEQLSAYECTFDLHPLSPHDLSDFEEKEVAFFAWLINHDHYERWWDEIDEQDR